MKVKFDSLNRFEVPAFYLCNPGCTYNDGILTNVIGCLSDTTDEELVMNFNTTSELNFRVYLIHRSDSDEELYINNLYKSVLNRRLIFVEDVGFFVITNVKDGFENGVHYKDVQAESCEYELCNRVLPYIEDSTYQFTELLELVVSSLPLWKIGTINGDIGEKYRTFEDVSVDQNVLSFLLEDMQDAYECIFEFDCVNRIIHVYDQNAYVKQTQIHLTKDDLINSIEITENSEDLYTAINVQGDNNLNVSPVNPLGTNLMYNFRYYLDWMTPGLKSKVDDWQKLVASKEEEYYNLNLEYYTLLTDLSNQESELERLQTQLDMYQRCRDNIVASDSTEGVEGYNAVIVENGGVPVGIQNEIADTLASIDDLMSDVRQQMDDTQSEIDNINANKSEVDSSIMEIHEEVDILSYFSEAEYEELCNYIFEGNYTDEYIIVTESMTYSEKFAQMKTLYDRAVAKLDRISEPTQEFSIDMENFLFSKEFERWSSELETGCLINVELSVDDIAALFLSNITVNYDDKTLSMTFGNRFNRFDPKAMFNDILGDVKKSANSIGYIKEILYPVKNGEFSALQEAIESSGVLTKNAALASTNQEILIDDTGILGRKLLDTGEYDDRQIKITNQTIVFTDDGWDTASTALGNFVFNNPFTGEAEEHYGVIADTLIGSLVLSEEVGIYNTSNSITLDQSGFTLTSDYTGKVPTQNVFTIQKKLLDENGNEYYEKQLYIDDNGNVVLNGTISVFTSSGSSSLEDLASGADGTSQYLHIKYSDDGKTFTGNILSADVSWWESGYYTSGKVDQAYTITTPLIPITSTNYVIAKFAGYNIGVSQFSGEDGATYVTSATYSTSNRERIVNLRNETTYIRVFYRADDTTTTFATFEEALASGEIVPYAYPDNGMRGEEVGAYIGTLVDFVEAASTNFDDYTWKMFTEDVEEELAELQSQIQSETKALNDTIQDNTDDLYEAIKSESDEINANIDSKLESMNSSVTEQINSVSSEIDSKYATIIADVNSQLEAHKADVGQYMTFNNDGLTLGATSSEFKTVIDNTGMYFKQGDTIVSYVNNNQLYIPNAVIESTLILGNFFFSPREDGGVSLTWQE